MTLLAIDPSSTKTGYAIMADSMTIIDAGLLKPNKTRDPFLFRVQCMACELSDMLDKERPDNVVIELPHVHVGHKLQGRASGLANYGFAAGAMWWACFNYSRHTTAVTADVWTGKIPKFKRQQNVCMAFPQYDSKKDKGGDIADAIGIACWYFSQQKAKRIAG